MSLLLAAGALASVILFYHWTIKTGGGFNPPGEEDYYNFQVRGWRSGHLYLSKHPSPEMLALADPYDPAKNGAVRMADASFYSGHYYLYFGAAPALLILWPYFILTGHELGTTWAIFILTVAGFLSASALWLSIRRRYFPESAIWMGPLGILLLGFSSHVLALQRRPLVWELPIASAYASSMVALLCLFVLVERPSRLVAGISGLAMGMAVASRPTYIVLALAFIPVGARYFRLAQVRSLMPAAALACLCIASVAAYNFARFGSPLEFGQSYQLSGIRESAAEHFSVRYIAHNAKAYLFQVPHVSRSFPFIAATIPDAGPSGYSSGWCEPICGICLTLPFVLFALFWPTAPRFRERCEASRLRCVMATLGIFSLSISAITLAYFLVTPRYMADFTPSLALLAVIGALAVERAAKRTLLKIPVSASIGLLGAFSVVSGIFISFDYHSRLFLRIWPNGYHSLESFFNSIFR